MIDGPPQVVPLSVDLHEHLVQVPTPLARAHPLDPALPDLRSKHRPEPVPPEPDGLVADLDPALVKKVLDVPKREREPHSEHHRQANDLGAGPDPLEGAGFCHGGTLRGRPPSLEPGFSDKAEESPWAEWRQGGPITARGVAMLLAPFGIRPDHDRSGRLYRLSAFQDAVTRYLEAPPD